MPSVSTALRRRGRRIELAARAAVSLLLVSVLLVGCSTGAARDARRDQARDASLPEQLAAEQATRTVQRYFPATSTPGPTKAPLPALGGLAITFGFRPDGSPDGSYASVPAGAGTAYVAAQLTGVSAGQVVSADVTDGWGNDVAKPELAIDPGPADRWVALPISLPANLAQGAYGIFLFVDETQLGSVEFGVSAPGSSAQLFPELPANPQARSTIGPPGSAAGPPPTATFPPSG
jgi:hypothetical protein